MMEGKVQKALRRVARQNLRRALCDAEYYGVSFESARDLVAEVYEDAATARHYEDSELVGNPKEDN
jgi:hypothetical protein